MILLDLPGARAEIFTGYRPLIRELKTWKVIHVNTFHEFRNSRIHAFLLLLYQTISYEDKDSK